MSRCRWCRQEVDLTVREGVHTCPHGRTCITQGIDIEACHGCIVALADAANERDELLDESSATEHLSRRIVELEAERDQATENARIMARVADGHRAHEKRLDDELRMARANITALRDHIADLQTANRRLPRVGRLTLPPGERKPLHGPRLFGRWRSWNDLTDSDFADLMARRMNELLTCMREEGMDSSAGYRKYYKAAASLWTQYQRHRERLEARRERQRKQHEEALT